MMFKDEISKIRNNIDGFGGMYPEERLESRDKFMATRRRVVMWATIAGLAAVLVYCLIMFCAPEVFDLVFDLMTLIVVCCLSLIRLPETERRGE